MAAQRLHVPSLIGAALMTAALANVAQFGALELETTDQYETVRIKEGHELRQLVAGHFGSTQERFGVYVALRSFAPGAVVATTTETPLVREQLLGLSLATAVRNVDVPVMTQQDVERLDAAVVASGTDETLGEYVVSVADGPVEGIVVVRSSERVYVADVRLLTTNPLDTP
jgi:hypothetical protein